MSDINVYMEGLLEVLETGVDNLAAGSAILVGPDFAFDATDSTTPTGQLTDAGYSAASVTFTASVDTSANYPRITLTVADFTFTGFDSTADGVHGVVFLLSTGTPLAAYTATASIQQFPMTATVADPISIDVGSQGLIRISTSA